MTLRIGIDVGQKIDPTAIIVTDTIERMREGLPSMQESLRSLQEPDVKGNVASDRKPIKETVFLARHIEELPLGTGYIEVAHHIRELIVRLRTYKPQTPDVLIDATGVGQPVVDILRKVINVPHRLIPCMLTGGSGMEKKVVHGYREYHVSKTFLASRLQSLLQSKRLKMPRVKEAVTVQRELGDFEIRAINAQHDQFGAFKSGSHDDLVIALGLACLEGDITGSIARSLGSGGREVIVNERPTVGATASQHRLSGWT